MSDHAIELLRFFTCGSVDDGKSTLIGRLLFDTKLIFEDQLEALERARISRGEEKVNLANLTDGLRAEREQGITIDVAYRYFATPKRRFIVADTPGHIQYTRNMVTGASSASLAVILIDARKGVIEQTRRHSCVAALLGIPHLVICVNKMDLVGYSEETFNKIRDDFTAFSTRLSVKHISFIPVSALTGENIVEPSTNMPWFRGEPLLSFLETVYIASDWNLRDPRFPVQWIIRPQTQEHHDFRGYAGQIASGIFRKGDEVTVMPTGSRSRIKDIVLLDQSLSEASAGQSVTLLLEDDIDISRGNTIVRSDSEPHIGKEIDARICWMHELALQKGKAYTIKHGSNTCRAIFKEIYYRVNIQTLEAEKTESLSMNEIARVTFKTSQPLVYDEYEKNRRTGGFIVIDEATHETVGAGMIIGPAKEAPPELKNVEYMI